MQSYSVTIVRDGAVQHLPPLRRELSDATGVKALYQTMMAVKASPKPFIYMCPRSLGVSYKLTFDLAGKTVQATADGSGCQFIHLPNGKNLWASGKDGAAFWADLGKILKLTPSGLRG